MKTSALAAAALATLLAVAGPLAAADSITILSLTPPSGVFPPSPGFAVARVAYDIQSSPWGHLAVFISQIDPPAGPGQTSPGGWFTPTWVPKGRGTADVRFGLNCNATSIPAGAIVQLTAHLTQAQNAGGHLGNMVATLTKQPLQYTFTCGPKAQQKPDLTSQNGIAFAGQPPTSWGGVATLHDSQAVQKDGGTCVFRARYDLQNLGAVPNAASFQNVFKILDLGLVAGSDNHPAGAVGPMYNQALDIVLKLKPGAHSLQLAIDPGNTVVEWNEGNNVKGIRYRLDGTCGGAGPFGPK